MEVFQPKIKIDAIKDSECLEYVIKFADKYCPDWYSDGDEFGIAASIAPWRFVARYNSGKHLKHEFKFNDYIYHKEIAKRLKDLGLDSEKFWYLLLFLYDYSIHYCIDGHCLTTTDEEQLDKFREALTDTRDVKIIVKKGSNQLAVIDNDFLIDSIREHCSKIRVGKVYSFKEIKATKSNYLAYYLAKQILSFTSLVDSIRERKKGKTKMLDAEKWLCAHLIHYTGIIKSSSMVVSLEYLKRLFSRYEDKPLLRMNSVYPWGD
jgi:hypothetical protein